jgi:pteridine reductase
LALPVEAMNERAVLITGAGQRLGAATATRLMDEGYYVFVHVRSSIEQATALVQAAAERNGRACGEVVVADLTVDHAVDGLISTVSDHELVKGAGLFGLVHNASFYSPSNFEETPLETYRSLARLHMDAPYALTQGLLSALERAGGSVVAVVDTSWGRAWGGLAHYTSTKAGLRQLMLNLAGELAGRVRVNCLAPGAIMAADWEADHFASVLEKVPLGRSGKADDIAAGIAFLLTHPTLSGHVLHVDGGWSIHEQ